MVNTLGTKTSAQEKPKIVAENIPSPEEVVIDEPLDDINGVKPQAAQAIKGMLKKGVRYFGSAGASLTHQAYGPKKGEEFSPEMAKVGLEGERATSKFLQEWIKDKPNAVLIDSVHINMDYQKEAKEMDGYSEEETSSEEPDEETGVVDGKDTDHVLLLGSKVVLIDSKKWKKKAKYSVSDNGMVLRYGKPFPGSRVRMNNAVFLWFKYLTGAFKIVGVVLVNAEEAKVIREANWFRQRIFKLVEIDRMEEFLNKTWNSLDEEDRTHINTTLVSQVALSAIKPLDLHEVYFNKSSVDKLLR